VKNLKFLGADGQILTAGKSGKIPPGQISGTPTNTAEAFRYFYHPDHLGSTSYVTDAAGEVYQHLEYMAFGETFVEEHSNTDRTPYLFNGKELDEETGLYYYGARYYDARTSVFQSVDRFAEKYSGVSPYEYGGNNPLKFIDVGGDSTYLVIYGAGHLNTNSSSHNVGDGFKKSAEARAQEIKDRPGYDPQRDQVVLVYAPSTEKFVDATNKKYSTGKIASLDVFSHGYPDGISLGGEVGNQAQASDYDKREINSVTLPRIDASNFEPKTTTTLNGCNIGYGEEFAFAQKMADYLPGKVRAFDNYSEFPTRNGDGKTLQYQGRMIRTVDRKNQLSKYTIFQKGKTPISP
jgi:RHS repeat-associated protein